MEWNAHSLNELVLNVLSRLFDKFVRSPSECSIVDVCIIEKKKTDQFYFSGKILQRATTRIKYLAPGFLGKAK